MQERPLPQWLLNLEAKKRARRAKDVKRKKIAAAKTVAEKDYLDANNRKMGWKTFAQLEDEAAERQRKADAREPESPRAFPFELLQTDVYDDSAVARYAYMHVCIASRWVHLSHSLSLSLSLCFYRNIFL